MKIKSEITITLSKILSFLIVIGGMAVGYLMKDPNVINTSVVAGCALMGVKTTVAGMTNSNGK